VLVAVDRRPYVVINADDLAKSSEGDDAILRCFDRRLISSATVMANMPRFGEAIALIHAGGFQDRLGVHLNLTEGFPLTDPIRRSSRFCSPAGQLLRVRGPIWRLTPEDANAVETELTAQIKNLLSVGIKPSHFDSHHHVHTQWPIGTIVLRLARIFGIPAIRLSRNCGSGAGWLKRAYKTVFNGRLERAGFARTRYFGSTRDAASVRRFAGPVEVMVHPGLDDEGRLIDRTARGEQMEDISAFWRSIGNVVSYRELDER
jgi:chitin disaccharide deacetylase